MVISIVRNLYQTDTAKKTACYFVHLLIDRSFKFADKELQEKCKILLFGFGFTGRLLLFDFVNQHIIRSI